MSNKGTNIPYKICQSPFGQSQSEYNVYCEVCANAMWKPKRKERQNETTVTTFNMEANERMNERKIIKINDASKTFPQIIAFEALTKWRERENVWLERHMEKLNWSIIVLTLCHGHTAAATITNTHRVRTHNAYTCCVFTEKRVHTARTTKTNGNLCRKQRYEINPVYLALC